MGFRDLLGRFVVLGGEVAERARATGSPTPSDLPLAALPTEDFDLSTVYEQEGISVATFTAEQALGILASLPKELQPETQRQVFKELLRAKASTLGVPSDVPLDDTRRKLEALTAFTNAIPGQIAEFTATSESEIAGLEQQIKNRRHAVEQARLRQQQITQRCRTEISRLSTVLQLLGISQPAGGRAE